MADATKLTDEEWNRLQDITERFEKDCADAFPRDPALYLPPVGDPIRDLVLDEILRIDLEIHWRKGKGNKVEQYFDRFPELRQREGRLLQLIEEEYRVRGHFGDRPDADEFVSRFPEYRGVLNARLRPHGQGEFHTMDSTIDIPLASAGNLTKIRRIGEGGFGEVWECRAPGGVPVAVKRIFATVSPKFIEREKQSLDLICSGKFRHPFLLQVFGWWVQSNQIHIAMELADESLDDRLKNAKSEGKPGLDADDVLQRIIRDAGEALDFLNFKCHILHRDVKPANMLLMSDRLKLCDFGLARVAQNLAKGAGQTLGAGTPVFIAPEVVQGFQSMQSDQYSLAVSYCMLRTGRPLFRGTVKEIREQHVHAKPSLSDSMLSDAEQLVLAKALCKEPTDRFSTSTEFAEELLAAVDSRWKRSSPHHTFDPVTPKQTDEWIESPESTKSAPNFTPLKRQRFQRATDPANENPLSIASPTPPPAVPVWLWIIITLAIFLLGIALGGFIFAAAR